MDTLTRAMDEFDAACRDARTMVEATPRFQNSVEERAQAYVAVAEARAMAYTFAIAPRLDHPHLHSLSTWHSYVFSIGQNCQDFRYGVMLLDGRETYTLRGHVGETALMLFQVQSHLQGHPDCTELANYNLHDHRRPDGRFELVISAQEQPGGWIRLDGRSSLNFVVVRQIFRSIGDAPGDLVVERVGTTATVPETSEDAIAERLSGAAELLRYFVREFVVGLYDVYLKLAGEANRIALVVGQDIASNLIGSPSTTYGLGTYDLEPHEALLIELAPSRSTYWSVQLGDVWSHALDFANYQTDINMERAVVDDDGTFRAVIAHQDPGIPNWLDTRGRREGLIVMRNYNCIGEPPTPFTKVVPLRELRAHLPSDTPTVTPNARAATLARRRATYHAAFGE
jgi:hypothetical protein